MNMQTALDAVPYMDEAYKQKLRPYVEKYEQYIKGFDQNNPYGVPIGLGNWAGVNMVLNFGIAVNYAQLLIRSSCGCRPSEAGVLRQQPCRLLCHPR